MYAQNIHFSFPLLGFHFNFIIYNRTKSSDADKQNGNLRDNDLVGTMILPAHQYSRFEEVLNKDIKELASYELTDYSLLLGVHDESAHANFGADWWEIWNRGPDEIRLYVLISMCCPTLAKS